MEADEKTEAGETHRLPGRPRAFDADCALDAAMHVFWEKGYEGTTLSDLTAAMGINRPSLYAAFGNKEELFRKVLDRYTQGPAAYMRTATEARTARASVEQLLNGAIDLLTSPGSPSICLIAQGMPACGDEAGASRREVIARRQMGERVLTARLKRAVAEGELPATTDVAALALYFATVLRGLGISASTGASREELLGVAQMALQVWPGESPAP